METRTFLHRGPVKYHGVSVHRELERGSFATGPEDCERKALGMGISLHRGSAGQPGVGSATGDFEI